MARFYSDDEQSYALEDLSAPFEHDLNEPPTSLSQRSSRSLLGRLLYSLGLSEQLGDRIDFDADDVPIFGHYHRRRPTKSLRETRRFRRTIVLRFLKKAAFATPVLILAFFGVLHLLEALVGRAQLFWNPHIYQYAFLGKHHRALVGAGATPNTPDVKRGAMPLPCHSHNDYWREKPLHDAIRWGCTGVEADVWLFDGELYVGHNPVSLAEDRTLRTLYIDPLLELLNNTGSASPSPASYEPGIFLTEPKQTLTLSIDIKTPGHETFEVVHQQLEPLRERGLLTYWNGDMTISRAITVVGTGNTPYDMIVSNGSYRDIFFDAPLRALWEPPRDPIPHADQLHDKDGEIDYGTAMSLPEDEETEGSYTLADANLFNTSTSYYASTSFSSTLGFVWRGHLSPRQMNIIRGQIRGAKRRGLKARYWDTPSWPTALRNHVWHVLVKEGADVLNVDDLEAAALQDWTIPVHDQGLLL